MSAILIGYWPPASRCRVVTGTGPDCVLQGSYHSVLQAAVLFTVRHLPCVAAARPGVPSTHLVLEHPEYL